jgi:hypothetical protein
MISDVIMRTCHPLPLSFAAGPPRRVPNSYEFLNTHAESKVGYSQSSLTPTFAYRPLCHNENMTFYLVAAGQPKRILTHAMARGRGLSG